MVKPRINWGRCASSVCLLLPPLQVKEALKCYKTSALEHPGVKMIAWERGPSYLGGKLWGFELPKRVFPCQTPAEVGRQEGKDDDPSQHWVKPFHLQKCFITIEMPLCPKLFP